MNTNNLVKLLLMSRFLHSSRHRALGAFCASASLRSPQGGLDSQRKGNIFCTTTGPSLAGTFKLGLWLQQQHEEHGGMRRRRVEQKGAAVAWKAQGKRQRKSGQEETARSGRGQSRLGRLQVHSGHRSCHGGAFPGCRGCCGREMGHEYGSMETGEQCRDFCVLNQR